MGSCLQVCFLATHTCQASSSDSRQLSSNPLTAIQLTAITRRCKFQTPTPTTTPTLPQGATPGPQPRAAASTAVTPGAGLAGGVNPLSTSQARANKDSH